MSRFNLLPQFSTPLFLVLTDSLIVTYYYNIDAKELICIGAKELVSIDVKELVNIDAKQLFSIDAEELGSIELKS